MFTNNTIKLSAIAGASGIEVRRDCDIAFVGKVPTRLNDRLVPCGQKKHIAEAAVHKGIAGIVTRAELAAEVPAHLGLAIAEDPVATSLRIHEALLDLEDFQWRGFDSQIDPSATIMPGAIVAERDVVIGRNTVIQPGAIVLERSVIGASCRIGPGAVIGCDAFEVETSAAPRRVLRQGGGVMLGDHVEIEAKSTIVRATFGGFTQIGAETKIDCQVHVAHDCVIGERVQIAACAELSGRVTTGNDAFIGPNCSISNGITIGEGATVTIGAVVVRDVEPGQRVTGNFALPHTKWLKFIRSVR